MKLLFASDIHGSGYWCERLLERINIENPDKIVLCGDLLYHGPRNDLPKEHNPKKVISILSELKDKIIAVRGNCEAEVDQMVLPFPVLADFTTINFDDIGIFVSHGHLFNKDNIEQIGNCDVLVNGHTHIYEITNINNKKYINIGSVSLPKENRENTYCMYENGNFYIKNFDGNILLSDK